MRPIGFVRTESSEEEIHTNRRNIVSDVVVNEELRDALEGIEGYSHLIVIFWMHRVSEKERRNLKTHPRHRNDLPQVGVFSVRERSRPNPIGLTVVELLERNGRVLKVKGLDAVDGTPVLDVKPYDYIDIRESISVPKWWFEDRPKGRTRWVKGTPIARRPPLRR